MHGTAPHPQITFTEVYFQVLPFHRQWFLIIIKLQMNLIYNVVKIPFLYESSCGLNVVLGTTNISSVGSYTNLSVKCPICKNDSLPSSSEFLLKPVVMTFFIAGVLTHTSAITKTLWRV